ncbi:MAG: hypothetical protein Q9181_007198 [Wetmoreana brouardii]
MLLFGAFTLLSVFADAATISKPALLTPAAANATANAIPPQLPNGTVIVPLNDLFYYHIPGTTINLYVRDTGDRLPYNDISACLLSFGVYIVRQITIHGDGPAFTQHNIHGSVMLNFVPHQMTWKDTGKVIDALETIVAKDNWTFASHVSIEDQDKGVIGYLTWSYRAARLLSAAATIDESNLASSASLNTTVTTSARSNGTLTIRPEDPHIHDIPGSHINLLCAGYGRALDTDSVFSVVAGAEMFVGGKIKQLGPLALVGEVNPFRCQGVDLVLYPSARLRWYDFLIALDGILDFVNQFGTFAFTFQVKWQGVRSLGYGQLTPATENS